MKDVPVRKETGLIASPNTLIKLSFEIEAVIAREY